MSSQALKRFYNTILNGERTIRSRDEAVLFIDAVCSEYDKIQCLARLCNKHTLQAVQKASCVDLSRKFLEDHASRLILYFATEEMRQIHGGELLRELFTAMLEPPLLWQAMRQAIINHNLSDPGFHAFVCLVLELLILLPPLSPLAAELGVTDAARLLLSNNRLLGSEQAAIRQAGYKLRETLRYSAIGDQQTIQAAFKPGGRHDNDFENFRKIAIFPTKDELLSEQPPFILPAETVLSSATDDRIYSYLDNQFRLLREDMLAELREDLQAAMSTQNNGKQRSIRLRNMALHGISCGAPGMLREASIALKCWDGRLRKPGGGGDKAKRKAYFVDNKSFLKHGSFGCIVINNSIVSFVMTDRDEDLLAQTPSILLLRVFGEEALTTTLLALKTCKQQDIEFIMIDTPFFAYEPVLSCLQGLSSVPLADVILGLQPREEQSSLSPHGLDDLSRQIAGQQGNDLQSLLKLTKETRLDHAQTQSLVAGLSQTISLIQGPPGTGKSFIGAVLAKCFLQFVPQTTILVLCYTNHALDQFLEDMLDIGVAVDDILRLGSKSTARTKPMTLYEQKAKGGRPSQAEWALSQAYRRDADNLSCDATAEGKDFSKWKHADQDILDALRFSEQDSRYFEALSVPQNDDGMSVVGPAGKALRPTYLIERWVQGRDAGVFTKVLQKDYGDIWAMPQADRLRHHCRWTFEAIKDRVQGLSDITQRYDAAYEKWSGSRNNKIANVMKTKRIIGCTTTAAAKYARQIALTKPGIVLVEEAGEVLESHVITAMSRDTKQLVLIGDHRQLRPKVKNYALTAERGDGYDLNRSLFERLVLGGHPHRVLTKQYRMRPRISALVRRLMYPELEDSASVQSRPDMHGLQSNVVFLDHHHEETSESRLKEQADEGSTVSRQNLHEVKMIIKIVRYLAQQGYGTDRQVVLTPYLGQLKLLVDELKADHDPVLNDLDSHDLVKAGLLTPASANLTRRPLRISTIDNFQGEESDVVIASLTRSNRRGDIGFMSAPERLNVLLSRAREGLIIVGNADTFKASKKGSATWTPFFNQLAEAGHFFDGLPIKCDRHPDRTMILSTPADFDIHCPNGGCNLPCAAMLKCGKHKCPEKCHQLVDHSKMQCETLEETQCPKGHAIRWRCWRNRQPCRSCDRDAKLEAERQQQQDRYYAQLTAIEDKIAEQHADIKRMEDDLTGLATLQRKADDLAQITKIAQSKKAVTASNLRSAAEVLSKTGSESVPSNNEHKSALSPAAEAWLHQKTFENADNTHIDAIMKLIGLESVKEQVLNLKDKVDTALRQGVNLTKERFGALLLGNPGTGKTTVARHYAKCLASMGVVSGSSIEETTASKLANGGIAAYKKLIDKLLQGGGGAFFVDEAYQLTSGGASPVGRQVLDAVMDDVENLTGKVVFIFAGYRREMETLVSHNPGLTSRFPYELSFQDYEDDELLRIFQYQLNEIFGGRMSLELGPDGLYARIMARRVGYGRGRPGFGNARAMENAIARALTRQAARLSKGRRAGQPCDDMALTKEDMLGVEPSSALEQSKAWAKLQELIGLDAVKKSVHALMHSMKSNSERELREEPLLLFNLNRIFLGSPGTGKTTVAKLYGQILADIGLLSNGEVMIKNPSDFVGSVLGESEKTTKGILSCSIGKVLVIDEAYGLHASSSSHDPYKSAVVDTIVAEVQSVPGDDRCVLLLGYETEMNDMLRNANPGLARRFPRSEAFMFDDFTDAELKKVLELKLKQQAFDMTEHARRCTMETLQRARNKLNFGNAGEVDIILNMAKQRQQERQASDGLAHNTTIEAVDVDPSFDKAPGSLSVRELFEGTIGHEELVVRLEKIQKVVSNMKSRGLDARETVPYNFVFAGPPGTGKTTTARKMGKIYHDLGILASDEVLEKSATDLIGQYVGTTASKTKQLLESSLGKVLLIDEAYRLTDGPYAKEAVDELVDLVTKPQFARRLIVILAGYGHDMQRLMSINPGLTSRFNEKVDFRSLRPEACVKLLLAKLQSKPFLDVSELQTLVSSTDCVSKFVSLVRLDGWANARDIETLATLIERKQLCATDSSSAGLLKVSRECVLDTLSETVSERERQAALLSPMQTNLRGDDRLRTLDLMPQAKPVIRHAQRTELAIEHEEDQHAAAGAEVEADQGQQRDEGVSDEVWQSLTLDKQQEAKEDDQYERLTARFTTIEEEDRKADQAAASLAEAIDREDDADSAERLRREQRRVKRELARRAQDEEHEKLRREKAEMDARRVVEFKAQQKLRLMGLCSAGFRWIKQSGGYRCAGGSHYVSDATLAAAPK